MKFNRILLRHIAERYIGECGGSDVNVASLRLLALQMAENFDVEELEGGIEDLEEDHSLPLPLHAAGFYAELLSLFPEFTLITTKEPR